MQVLNQRTSRGFKDENMLIGKSYQLYLHEASKSATPSE
jgi:hypothetical protein